MIRITLDLPPKELSPNARPHPQAKRAKVAAYREHAQDKAMAACHEQDVRESLTEAVVGVTYYHKTMRYLDRDNILASLKPAFDGVTRSGLWCDDRDVIYLPVVRAKDAERPRVEIVIYPTVPKAWQTFVDSLEGSSSQCETSVNEHSGASSCGPSINANPIVNGVYRWGDVTVEISPDASEVTITHGGDHVYVHSGFFQDVANLLISKKT